MIPYISPQFAITTSFDVLPLCEPCKITPLLQSSSYHACNTLNEHFQKIKTLKKNFVSLKYTTNLPLLRSSAPHPFLRQLDQTQHAYHPTNLFSQCIRKTEIHSYLDRHLPKIWYIWNPFINQKLIQTM